MTAKPIPTAILSATAAYFLLGSAALVLGGGGHGLVEPLLLMAAPIPVQWMGYYGLPLVVIYWGNTGYVAARGAKWMLPMLLVLHYVVGAIVVAVALRTELNDSYFPLGQVARDLAWPLAFWIIGYLAMQGILWFIWKAKKGRLS
ncbi:hypothetical protein SAMN05421819_3109 [Bryocella elongata]|uniref:Uncharacterized protein n=1 Tax=Bryocella elongata TaxID=863522 RepID=A0A1H6AEC7_9BACT|nr:hypothetical protein [Bryocella elongata]SEG47093.1 hypothetical protein SAMN05421819_3109 [Bryocella elongata]